MTEEIVNIALLGSLSYTRGLLESFGGVRTDSYSDGAGVALDICRGRSHYDLIVIHAPYGEGFPSLPFDCGNGKSRPVYLVNDPPGETAKIVLKLLVEKIRKAKADGRTTTETAQAVTIEARNQEE